MIPAIILTIEDPDDSKFMEELYISYKWIMYSQIMKLISDPWTAEDILQTSIEKLIDKIELLKKTVRNGQNQLYYYDQPPFGNKLDA